MEENKPNNFKTVHYLGFIFISINFLFLGYKLYFNPASTLLSGYPIFAKYLGLFILVFFITIIYMIIKKFISNRY